MRLQIDPSVARAMSGRVRVWAECGHVEPPSDQEQVPYLLKRVTVLCMIYGNRWGYRLIVWVTAVECSGREVWFEKKLCYPFILIDYLCYRFIDFLILYFSAANALDSGWRWRTRHWDRPRPEQVLVLWSVLQTWSRRPGPSPSSSPSPRLHRAESVPDQDWRSFEILRLKLQVLSV